MVAAVSRPVVGAEAGGQDRRPVGRPGALGARCEGDSFSGLGSGKMLPHPWWLSCLGMTAERDSVP